MFWKDTSWSDTQQSMYGNVSLSDLELGDNYWLEPQDSLMNFDNFDLAEGTHVTHISQVAHSVHSTNSTGTPMSSEGCCESEQTMSSYFMHNSSGMPNSEHGYKPVPHLPHLSNPQSQSQPHPRSHPPVLPPPAKRAPSIRERPEGAFIDYVQLGVQMSQWQQQQGFQLQRATPNAVESYSLDTHHASNIPSLTPTHTPALISNSANCQIESNTFYFDMLQCDSSSTNALPAQLWEYRSPSVPLFPNGREHPTDNNNTKITNNTNNAGEALTKATSSSPNLSKRSKPCADSCNSSNSSNCASPSSSCNLPNSNSQHPYLRFLQESFPLENDDHRAKRKGLGVIMTSNWKHNNEFEPHESFLLQFLSYDSTQSRWFCLFWKRGKPCECSCKKKDHAKGHIRSHLDLLPFVCKGPWCVSPYPCPVSTDGFSSVV